VPFDPATFDLGDLFRDPDMFDSADDWGEAGFKILRESDNKICVASHKAADGYLFKKYVSSGKRDALDDQLQNYETRIEGARRLRAFIAERRLQYVVAPRKWLRELPPNFGSRKQPAHILVVDRLDLLAADEAEEQYGRINEAVLRDLCVTLHAFRGLDSTAKNVPFTRDGKVAFIDTEHWNRHSDSKRSKQRPFLKYLGEHLSGDSRKIVKKTLEQLDGGRSYVFDDEEDTSSGSSS
jgi:hypothetical protein